MENESQSNVNENKMQNTKESQSMRINRQQILANWTEIVAAIMLGFVAVATAWSGYQSARWGGVQATLYNKASATRVESIRAQTTAGQLVQIDIGTFTSFADAYAAGDEFLTTFYLDRFREEFKPAFEAWIATEPIKNPNAPSSPFSMPEYAPSLLQKAGELEEEASSLFAEGQAANQQSDDYVLTTVILASVLFFASIAQRFDWLPVRVAVLAMALVMLAYGLYNLITYPIY